jgi:hypothetical protein
MIMIMICLKHVNLRRTALNRVPKTINLEAGACTLYSYMYACTFEYKYVYTYICIHAYTGWQHFSGVLKNHPVFPSC